eukprot:364626-Chlamydomonas_euryale.AAC.1
MPRPHPHPPRPFPNRHLDFDRLAFIPAADYRSNSPGLVPTAAALLTQHRPLYPPNAVQRLAHPVPLQVAVLVYVPAPPPHSPPTTVPPSSAAGARAHLRPRAAHAWVQRVRATGVVEGDACSAAD